MAQNNLYSTETLESQDTLNVPGRALREQRKKGGEATVKSGLREAEHLLQALRQKGEQSSLRTRGAGDRKAEVLLSLLHHLHLHLKRGAHAWLLQLLHTPLSLQTQEPEPQVSFCPCLSWPLLR
jgi:hypothetical protein